MHATHENGTKQREAQAFKHPLLAAVALCVEKHRLDTISSLTATQLPATDQHAKGNQHRSGSKPQGRLSVTGKDQHQR